MKYFNFDTAIYKILNESSLFDDDDELLPDEIKVSVIKL